MALRSLLSRWPAAAGLAAASMAAGGIAYCERDVMRGAKALREINSSPHAKKVGLFILASRHRHSHLGKPAADCLLMAHSQAAECRS